MAYHRFDWVGEATGRRRCLAGDVRREFTLHSDNALDVEPKRPSGDASGTRIASRYRVLGLLGRGGAGEVYRVRDEVDGRELALKRLRKDRASSASTLALFEREYHTLAQLDHPCVVRTYDYGVDEGGAYYTMELIDGTDLSKGERLDWQSACAVLRDVASAMALLHSRRWVHCDPSPRNVIRVGGTAKLIDFGAMAPFGAIRGVVGTPALVAPEVLQHQPLDSRADLYALGALAYVLLTGRHAYPASNFEVLPELWGHAPRAPEELVAGIPSALGRLVLDLLNLDVGARPSSAADVIGTLEALLGGNLQARPAIETAYITTPRLCGRERQLAAAQEQMTRTLRGQGSAVLIEGARGVGRSRFLDACVLDAKLIGASVLRAGASDAAGGEYGVARALCEQLLVALPELASQAAELQRPLLGSVVPSLRKPGHAEPSPERRQLQTALRDWLRAVARNKHIVIAVDDFEAIDEPSASWLASLVHRNERRSLLVVASVRSDAPASAALEVLRASALAIELLPLSESDSEALLQSVFGNARDLTALTQRAYELSAGNATELMELVEHLVRHGHARYVAGGWSLPEQLGPGALPASIDAALGLRIDALGPDARVLAQALALSAPGAFQLRDYPRLLETEDHARVFAALEALGAAGVLQADGDRYRFAHQRWSELLVARLSDEARRALHARIAGVMGRSADPLRLAYHDFESGQEHRAIESLLSVRRQHDQFSDELCHLLERAALVAQRLELPHRSVFELQSWLVGVAAVLGKLDVFMRHGPAVFAELDRVSGLCEYRALTQLGHLRRLLRILWNSQRRHFALPRGRRICNPITALTELGHLLASCASLAMGALDAALLDPLPTLAPFAGISTPAWMVETMHAAARDTLRGRRTRAYRLATEVLARISKRDHGGFVDWAYDRSRNGLILAVAETSVILGHEEAQNRLAELLERPGFRSDAWRWLAIYHWTLGENEQAKRCERRADLSALQDGTRQFWHGKALLGQAIAHWISDDLEGLRRLQHRFEQMAARYPGWNVARQLVRAHDLRLKGDHARALEIIETVLPLAPPGGHLLSAWVAAAHVWLLSADGRPEQAAEAGLEYARQFESHDYLPSDTRNLALATADALARAGRFAKAIELCDAAVAELEAAGARGALIGNAYETRATIALAMHEPAAFELWAERCRVHYARGDSAALRTKFGRLMRQARQRGSAEPEIRVADISTTRPRDGTLTTVMERMQRCASPAERARCALRMILEQVGASEGHLFGLLEGKLKHLASVSEAPFDMTLGPELERQVRQESRGADETAMGRLPRPTGRHKRGALAQRFAVTYLRATRDEGVVTVAVAAIPRAKLLLAPPEDLVAALAKTLLEHDDVDPITRLG
jgi:hypothetical protein